MSWDLYVCRLPADLKAVDELPLGYEPEPIGTRAWIQSAVQRAFPEADFSNPAWGRIQGPDYSMEISLGDELVVSFFSFHLRGSDSVIHAVQAILDELGLRALDGSSPTGIFDPNGGSVDGLREWRAFRDRVMRDGST